MAFYDLANSCVTAQTDTRRLKNPVIKNLPNMLVVALREWWLPQLLNQIVY